MTEPLPGSVVSKLKGMAQRLDPLARVGKAGLSDGFLASLNQILEVHELVKVRFDDFKDEKKALAAQMAEKTGSRLIWIVGHVAVLYRQNPNPEKQKIKVVSPSVKAASAP